MTAEEIIDKLLEITEDLERLGAKKRELHSALHGQLGASMTDARFDHANLDWEFKGEPSRVVVQVNKHHQASYPRGNPTPAMRLGPWVFVQLKDGTWLLLDGRLEKIKT